MTGLKVTSESLRSVGTVLLKAKWSKISILIDTVDKSLEIYERTACTCFACSGKIEKVAN